MKLLITIFVSFFKLLNSSLDKYSLFLSHVKYVFLVVIAIEQKTILVLLLGMTINNLFHATANIQLRKFRFREGVKLV